MRGIREAEKEERRGIREAEREERKERDKRGREREERKKGEREKKGETRKKKRERVVEEIKVKERKEIEKRGGREIRVRRQKGELKREKEKARERGESESQREERIREGKREKQKTKERQRERERDKRVKPYFCFLRAVFLLRISSVSRLKFVPEQTTSRRLKHRETLLSDKTPARLQRPPAGDLTRPAPGLTAGLRRTDSPSPWQQQPVPNRVRPRRHPVEEGESRQGWRRRSGETH
ncbi:hypothetical protein WMY93_034044, partial [Mugilogobius chulae]